jgi:pectinesterase
VFTVEKIDIVAPVFPTKTFARYVPERLDDFGRENDKIGHRTYGARLWQGSPRHQWS